MNIGYLGCFVKVQIPSSCTRDSHSVELRHSPENCILNNSWYELQFEKECPWALWIWLVSCLIWDRDWEMSPGAQKSVGTFYHPGIGRTNSHPSISLLLAQVRSSLGVSAALLGTQKTWLCPSSRVGGSLRKNAFVEWEDLLVASKYHQEKEATVPTSGVVLAVKDLNSKLDDCI